MIIGVPIFLIGCGIAHTFYPIGYFIGILIGLIGASFTSKVFNCKLGGEEALLGVIIYGYSMLPNSYMWTQDWFELSTIMIIRIVMSFIGGVWVFSSTSK